LTYSGWNKPRLESSFFGEACTSICVTFGCARRRDDMKTSQARSSALLGAGAVLLLFAAGANAETVMVSGRTAFLLFVMDRRRSGLKAASWNFSPAEMTSL